MDETRSKEDFSKLNSNHPGKWEGAVPERWIHEASRGSG